MSFRPYVITPSPSQTMATTGPELRKSQRPLKKGLSFRS
uniref:Uncharacterized protein MANES_02G009500 n=1 Tax=Rhizophora mucronata TaxID=61149 RepID=A0A2P2LFA6_RHIMU